MSHSAAFATSLLFSTQPLLWGHAFINPKDPPFLTFFLVSVCLGFEMTDAIAQNAKDKTIKIFLAAFVLGIATSIRVLGPLAGLLILIYFITQLGLKEWKSFLTYGVVAIAVMFLTWPYLWENPIANFINVFGFMSDNPTNLAVLFNGEIHRAGSLPLRYLPFMLAATLTEPVWFLFLIGLIGAFWMRPKIHPLDQNDRRKYFASLALILSWFVILLAYVILRRPAMYDGFRHFLFILPPVFIFIGFAFEFIFERINLLVDAISTPRISNNTNNPAVWLHAGLIIILISPGLVGVLRLHPYEYAYYNSFIGGTNGAFRNYETDYWLTCYKDAVEQLNDRITAPVNLFVKREAYIAATYAEDNVNVHDLRGAEDQARSGDYVLVNTRTNEDRSTFKDAPIIIEVKRGNATFCIVRQIP